MRRGDHGAPPRGCIPPGTPPARKALLLADMLVRDPEQTSVIAGEIEKYWGAFASCMGNFTEYDIDVMLPLCALNDMAHDHATHVSAAMEGRPAAVHALAHWVYRMPIFLPRGERGTASIWAEINRDPDDPLHRLAPQAHEMYAKAMVIGVLPRLLDIIRHRGSCAHLLSAPGLPGVLARLRELAGRPTTGVEMQDLCRDSAGLCLEELLLQATAAAAGSPSAAAGAQSREPARQPARQPAKACGLCGAAGSAAGGQLKRCAACRAVYYCSEVCQRGAWKEHRKECTPPPAAAKA